jgi:TatD DNase family protein
MLIDAHCHLFFENQSSESEFLNHISELNVSTFITSALYKNDLNKIFDLNTFKITAGIHPYLFNQTDLDLNFLDQLCLDKKIIAIGEIGLDKRYDHQDTQKELLLSQLDLARSYNLPVIFHCVKAYYDLYKILKNNFPTVTGIMHAFTANLEIYENFSKFNLLFSLSKRLDFSSKDKPLVHKIVSDKRFVFETDYEYNINLTTQTNALNYSYEVHKINSEINYLSDSLPNLIEIQYNNLKNLFPAFSL